MSEENQMIEEQQQGKLLECESIPNFFLTRDNENGSNGSSAEVIVHSN